MSSIRNDVNVANVNKIKIPTRYPHFNVDFVDLDRDNEKSDKKLDSD